MTRTSYDPATDHGIAKLADALMRGVVATEIMDSRKGDSQITRATEIMREELHALLGGEDKGGGYDYSAERDCIKRGSLHQNWILAAVIARCAERIAKEVA